MRAAPTLFHNHRKVRRFCGSRTIIVYHSAALTICLYGVNCQSQAYVGHAFMVWITKFWCTREEETVPFGSLNQRPLSKFKRRGFLERDWAEFESMMPDVGVWDSLTILCCISVVFSLVTYSCVDGCVHCNRMKRLRGHRQRKCSQRTSCTREGRRQKDDIVPDFGAFRSPPGPVPSKEGRRIIQRCYYCQPMKTREGNMVKGFPDEKVTAIICPR
jgi:hypothetical protein